MALESYDCSHGIPDFYRPVAFYETTLTYSNATGLTGSGAAVGRHETTCDNFHQHKQTVTAGNLGAARAQMQRRFQFHIGTKREFSTGAGLYATLGALERKFSTSASGRVSWLGN